MLGRASVSCCDSSQGLRCLDRFADVVELLDWDEDPLAEAPTVANLAGGDAASDGSD